MRTASRVRKTAETAIDCRLNLDQTEPVTIATGVGFFDHMLTLFARHGRFSLEIQVKGDLEVDAHHTVEDVGIVIGECLQEALGEKIGVVRYGTSFVPMDESLALVSLDLSGRAYLVFDATFSNPKLGSFDTELTQEFFQAFAYHGKITLHEKVLYGQNTHHKIEALFKATGRALREAVTIDPEIKGVNSTKGTLA